MDENTLYLCKINGFCRMMTTIIIFALLFALFLIIPVLGVFLAVLLVFVFLIVLIMVLVDNSSEAKDIERKLDEQNNREE